MLTALVLTRDDYPGRQVGQANRRVGLVDVLTTCTRRAVGVAPPILLVDVDLTDSILEEGNHRHRRKARLAALLRVEGRHAHEPVDPALCGEKAVREPALHDHRRREEPGFL